MRHFLYKTICLLAVYCFLPNINANAQFNAGPGVAFGTEIESIGFNFRAGYLIRDRVNITADVYFFFNRQETDLERQWREFNLNATYRIYATERFFLYPLAGFNLSTITTEFDQGNGANPSIIRETAPGINAGGGLAYTFNNLTPFLEGKYSFGSHNQAVFSLGVLYYLRRNN